jgi:hypothetical protein
MSGIVDSLLALAAAVAALILSFWAARQAQRASRVVQQLGERVVEIEQARDRERLAEAHSAQLVPSIEREFGPAGQVRLRLQLENIGRGSATGVRVRVEGQPLSASSDGSAEPAEIVEIPPGIAVSYPMAPGLVTPEGNAKVELNWLDPAGRQQTSRMTLRGL